MKNEITALTGIRGLFAIYVMFYHINPMASKNLFLWNGYLSVDLFFILSGFILCFVYQNKFSKNVLPTDYLNFLFNRLCRIYPLYFIATTVVFIFYLTNRNYSTLLYDYTINIFFVQSVTGSGFVAPAWSLATEVIAYFFVPFLILLLFKAKQSIFILSFASICMLGIVSYKTADLNVYTGWEAIARCTSDYVLGVLSYQIFLSTKDESKNNNISCLVTLLISLLLLSFKGLDLLVIPLFVLLIPLIATSNGIVVKLLSIAPVYYLGEISYSVYIWHGVVSRQFSWQVRQLAETMQINPLWLMVCLSLIISIITYHTIEKPSQKILKKVRAQYFNRSALP